MNKSKAVSRTKSWYIQMLLHFDWHSFWDFASMWWSCQKIKSSQNKDSSPDSLEMMSHVRLWRDVNWVALMCWTAWPTSRREQCHMIQLCKIFGSIHGAPRFGENSATWLSCAKALGVLKELHVLVWRWLLPIWLANQRWIIPGACHEEADRHFEVQR